MRVASICTAEDALLLPLRRPLYTRPLGHDSGELRALLNVKSAHKLCLMFESIFYPGNDSSDTKNRRTLAPIPNPPAVVTTALISH